MHFLGSTDTEMVHNNIIGFRPYRSAAIPHKMAVKALPIINEAASRNKIYYLTLHNVIEMNGIKQITTLTPIKCKYDAPNMLT